MLLSATRAMITFSTPPNPCLVRERFLQIRQGFPQRVLQNPSMRSQRSAAALHPRSRAQKQPARRYGTEVMNELVRIHKKRKTDGWAYGSRSIYYEAALQETFPGPKVPSVATIARLLSAVGQVDAAPKKRPKASYIPFPAPPPWRCGSWTCSNTRWPLARS